MEQAGSNVRIKTAQGREFTLPITRFSEADQEYVKEVAARALFQTPEPFEGRGKGAIIIASAKGKVMVIPTLRYSGSQEVKPVARDVIVGEPLPRGSTIITGANADFNNNHKVQGVIDKVSRLTGDVSTQTKVGYGGSGKNGLNLLNGSGIATTAITFPFFNNIRF